MIHGIKLMLSGKSGGIKFGDVAESKLGEHLKIQLPDTIKKSRRIDRNIIITAKQKHIDAILGTVARKHFH
jgi:hypothetical protein